MERDVAGVIGEQIELDLIRSRTAQVEIVERLAVGRHHGGVEYAMHILPTHRLGGQEGSECVAVRLGTVFPICPIEAQPSLSPSA